MDRGWDLRLSGTLSAFSLDLRNEPDWRRALSGRVRLVLGDHFHFEATAISPLINGKEHALAFPTSAQDEDGFGMPGVEQRSPSERRDFSLMTAGVGFHTRLGRVRPFLGAGGGRIKVEGDTRTAFLLYSGVDFRFIEEFGLVVDYRVSRVDWGPQGTGWNRELGLGFSVTLIPTPSALEGERK